MIRLSSRPIKNSNFFIHPEYCPFRLYYWMRRLMMCRDFKMKGSIYASDIEYLVNTKTITSIVSCSMHSFCSYLRRTAAIGTSISIRQNHLIAEFSSNPYFDDTVSRKTGNLHVRTLKRELLNFVPDRRRISVIRIIVVQKFNIKFDCLKHVSFTRVDVPTSSQLHCPHRSSRYIFTHRLAHVKKASDYKHLSEKEYFWVENHSTVNSVVGLGILVLYHGT